MKPQSYEITVDTLKSISHSSMEFSQNNLNISELIINITEDEKALPLNDTDKIIVYFKKPDKTVVFQDKEIDILDKAKGKIKVLLTTQTLVRAGEVHGEISIERVEDGTKKRASTYGFSFKVRSSIASNESIESTNEFQVFDKILKVGEKFEDFEEEDFEGIIEAGAKAETALVKATENTNQIGILSGNITDIKKTADGSLPKTGGTMTGEIIIDSGALMRFKGVGTDPDWAFRRDDAHDGFVISPRKADNSDWDWAKQVEFRPDNFIVNGNTNLLKKTGGIVTGEVKLEGGTAQLHLDEWAQSVRVDQPTADASARGFDYYENNVRK
ncbi:BppU family phage baseplate upper protein, partial [Bacillus paranthracis]|uniref:BppU family phage baseplate upper protein n=1 Tax=Bacillus paranthracis TaxID=2026186 RepID=UPI0035587A34